MNINLIEMSFQRWKIPSIIEMHLLMMENFQRIENATKTWQEKDNLSVYALKAKDSIVFAVFVINYHTSKDKGIRFPILWRNSLLNIFLLLPFCLLLENGRTEIEEKKSGWGKKLKNISLYSTQFWNKF